MFAALHGELALHPWQHHAVTTSDAYSLFVARSSAMGWLAEPAERAPNGVWGMNDAGHEPGSGRIAWFQVSLTGLAPAGRPLPVQAFLSCVDDVVTRIGTVRLRAIQLLLPVQSLETPTGPSLLQDAGWFADVDPHSVTRVRVTLDGGQDPSIRAAAPAMRQWMQQLKQDVFSCDSYSLTDHDAMASRPAVIDELWRGPPLHRATFHGTLVEWSLDALGWLAAFLADASHRHGVSTPLMLTTSRPERLAGT
jgi:hypothetical protein